MNMSALAWLVPSAVAAGMLMLLFGTSDSAQSKARWFLFCLGLVLVASPIFSVLWLILLGDAGAAARLPDAVVVLAPAGLGGVCIAVSAALKARHLAAGDTAAAA